MIYDIRDYGAVGDGTHNDTSAIQAAVDKCSSNGGGQVLLAGNRTYRSGTVILRSNVEFYIEKGTVLKASDSISDFDMTGNADTEHDQVNIPTYENCEYDGRPGLFFLFAINADDITITGEGSIDGNEEIFYGKVTPYHIDGSFYPRVPLIFLENVINLTVTNITLKRSAFWTLHMVGCRFVTIQNITILNNRLLANCDGIDPDHCKNVHIRGCHIESADDCIVFKNTSYGGSYGTCENITVDDCDLSSTSAAIKFGTESEDTFRNISIKNCRIKDSNRGISLQLRDKGSIEDVHFENISIETRLVSKEHWWGDGEPIALTAVERRPGSGIGHIRNITFRDIRCNSENGILIYGDSSENIRDISFTDVNLHIIEGCGEVRTDKDLRPCESSPFAKADPSAIYIKNAINIDVSGCDINIDDKKRAVTRDILQM